MKTNTQTRNSTNTLHSARPWLMGLLLSSLGTACGELPEPMSPEVDVIAPEEYEANHALFNYGTEQLWPNGIVPVCFSPASTQRADFTARSTEIHNWIDETWGRAASIRFDGWGVCPSNPVGTVRIHLSDGDGCSSQVGYRSNRATEMYLGVNYWTWHAGVVHEFGHALGFEHEFDRADGDNCNGSGTVSGGNTFGTPYDRDSMLVSTYCGSQRTQLSPWDVVGMRTAYGTKNRGYVVGQGNNCLDVPDYDDNFTSSHPLQTWSCWGGDNQTWSYSAVDRTLSGRTAYSSMRYVDEPYGGYSNGNAVWNRAYTGAASQKWNFKGVRIKGMGDMCLDVPGESYFSGQKVQIWQCHGGANQNWDVRGGHNGNVLDYYISPSTRPDLCLAYDSNFSLLLRPCVNNLSNVADTFQRFTFNNGKIYAGSSRYFSVSGWRPNNGATVELLTATVWSVLSQATTWHITGPIQANSGKCLNLDTSNGHGDGTPVQVWSCQGTRNQEWDYYF